MKHYKNRELMLAAGSKKGDYDIEAPDQWRWVMLRANDPHERAMAWIKSKTTAFGHDSPFCVDEHGRALYVQHLAADMGWKEQTARNVLSELQNQGRIKLRGKRIWYSADIPQAHVQDEPEEPQIPLTPEQEQERRKGELFNSVQRYFGAYVVDFIEKLSEKKQLEVLTGLESRVNRRREFFADAMAALRNIADRVDDTTLLEIGIPKKRLPKRRTPEAKFSQLKTLLEPSFVQGCFDDLYKPESDSVDARASYSAAAAAKKSTPPAPRTAVQPQGFSSSSISESKPEEKTVPSSKADDDEKTKPEIGAYPPKTSTIYATAKDEVKAMYFAKAGEYPTVLVLDRIEALLIGKNQTWGSYLEVLKPHLAGNWKNPPGFITNLAQTGFSAPAVPPQLKPKPKCPTCKADNGRGAILLDGAIAPCPDCSTEEWRNELAVKLDRNTKAKGTSGND